jgi:hypothetical protein
MTNFPTRLGNSPNPNSNPDEPEVSVKLKLRISQDSLKKMLKQLAVGVSIGLSFWGGFKIALLQQQSQLQTQSQTQINNNTCNVGQSTAKIPSMPSPTTSVMTAPPPPAMPSPNTPAKTSVPKD